MKKIYFWLEIFIIIIILILYFIFIGIPEFKNNFGSSDKFINTNNYEDMVEIYLNNINFAIVINKDKNIEQLFFFTNDSVCLYNKNIEKNNLTNGLVEIFEILIEKNYLKNNDSIKLVSYEGKYLEYFKKAFSKAQDKFLLDLNIVVEKSSLEDKLKELEVDFADDNSLFILDLYSKNIVDNYEEKSMVTEELSFEYAHSVYIKLEKYLSTNENDYIDISLIPANSEGNIFPDKESYYKIDNNQLEAYIKFDKYDYCFMGKDNYYKKGVC